jgi:nitrite reductase (NADH) large subunit
MGAVVLGQPMLAAETNWAFHFRPREPAPIVVVGTGPVGMHIAHKLLDYNPQCAISLYGDEPWEPYNRVRLSTFLSGETSWAGLTDMAGPPAGERVVTHYNTPITAIDRERHEVINANGVRQVYSSLVLATGSSPHVPSIPGITLPGVFTFRNLDDVQQLLARRARSRKTVIIGGGVLGLEAARAMQRLNTEVTVVEHSPRLMNRQLDDAAGEMLREHLMGLGIRISLFDGVKKVLGDIHVSGVELNSGRCLDCDTIVVVTGIRPNIELARGCGLSVGRGIRVNDNMQTRDADVYAIGECAEHRGQLYGLLAPGLEQAAVAAHSIMGGSASYSGSVVATQLKVVDQNVFSMGVTGDEHTTTDYVNYVYQNHGKGIYRKLITRRNRLAGVIAVGDWPAQSRIQESITQQRRLWPWQLHRFRRYGELWPAQEGNHVSSWPANRTVCNCRNVSRSQLTEAMQQGCVSLESLSRYTGASTVCGSCKPLLGEMLGEYVELEPEPGRGSLLASAVLALFMAIVTLTVMPVPYSKSMVPELHIDMLWRDGLLKQVSGFSLLGLSVVALLLSLRKRIKRFQLGQFAWWRVVHAALGLFTLLTLFAHTGFRLGEHLNFALMLSFLLLGFSGALAGGIAAVQERLDIVMAKRLRSMSNWVHILLFWPLPALLGLHIFAVYYF